MSTKDGWVQGYNAQAIVNPKQIVLAVDVSQDPSDIGLFEPMNERLTQTLTTAGITAEVELELADAGYCSHANLTCPAPTASSPRPKTGSNDAPPADSDTPTAPRHPASQPPRRWNTSCAPPKATPPTNSAPADRTRLRRPQTQPPDPALPPPWPDRCPQRMGVHPPRRQHAQALPTPHRSSHRLTPEQPGDTNTHTGCRGRLSGNGCAVR